MSSNVDAYIKSHNLVNRIYDMVYYFGIIKNSNNEKVRLY